MIWWPHDFDEAGVNIGYTAHLMSQEGQSERENWPEF